MSRQNRPAALIRGERKSLPRYAGTPGSSITKDSSGPESAAHFAALSDSQISLTNWGKRVFTINQS